MLRLQSDILDSRYGKEVNLGCAYAMRPLTISLPIRYTSVVFDLLSCLLMALILRGMFPDRRVLAGVLGSLAFGCNYLAVRNGHFAVTDSMLILLSPQLSTSASSPSAGLHRARPGFVLDRARLWREVSAVCLGPLCLVAGITCLVVFPRRGRTLLWGLLSIPAAVAGLIVASPGVITEWSTFVKGLHSHAYRFGEGAREHLIDATYVIPPGWRYHLFTNLPIAFGKIGLVLAVTGMLVALVRARREGFLLWIALFVCWP